MYLKRVVVYMCKSTYDQNLRETLSENTNRKKYYCSKRYSVMYKNVKLFSVFFFLLWAGDINILYEYGFNFLPIF